MRPVPLPAGLYRFLSTLATLLGVATFAAGLWVLVRGRIGTAILLMLAGTLIGLPPNLVPRPEPPRDPEEGEPPEEEWEPV